MSGKGKGALRIAIEDWFETFDLGKIIAGWFKRVGEEQEEEIAGFFPDLLGMIENVDELPESIKRLAKIKGDKNAQGGILSMGGFAAQIGQSMAGGILQPLVSLLNYSMDRIIKSARPDVQTLLIAHRRGFISDEDVKELSKQLGWSDYLQEMWFRLSKQVLGASDYLTLWRRKKISETELDIKLREQFFDEKTIGELKELTQVIPGIGDLINMVVREAFNPGIVKKFGYDQEFPEQVIPFAEAQGLSREWVEKFWYSHWTPISIGQGFEMLHRLRPGTTNTPFEKTDLMELMKIQDISTYWRDRLIQVSYQPLTRVDVRRMHDMGILDTDGVLGSYLDAGYNQKNAELMTDFTIKFNEDEVKKLSRGAIERAYKKGLLSESEAVSILSDAGYRSDQAQFYIDLISFDLMEEETDLEIDLIHTLYKSGEIVKSEAHSQLNTLNLPENQISYLLKKWELEKLKSVRLPSETELEKWYKLDYISSDDYLSGLVDKNYQEETVNLFLRQADQEIAENAQKTELNLLEIQEKLQLSLIKSDYRIARSNLDVQIAQNKSNIAEIKLLAHDIEDTEIIEEMKKRIDLIKLEIKELQVDKAMLKLSEEIETEPEETENEEVT